MARTAKRNKHPDTCIWTSTVVISKNRPLLGTRSVASAHRRSGLRKKGPRKDKRNNHIQCQQCHRTETPKWRPGPQGSKSLCNVCGLLYVKKMQKVKIDNKFDGNSESSITKPTSPKASSSPANGCASPTCASRHPLLEGIASCFNSPIHADLTICFGDIQLPAHSLVLASQSDYFNTILNKGGLRNISEIQFLGGNVHALWRAFEYMYRGQYSDSPCLATDADDDDDDLIKHVRVYLIASMFLLDNLQLYALKKFEKTSESLGQNDVFESFDETLYRLSQGLQGHTSPRCSLGIRKSS